MQGGEEKCARTVDGRCPDQGDSRFSSSRDKKDFKIESKDRNLPSGKFFVITTIFRSEMEIIEMKQTF